MLNAAGAVANDTLSIQVHGEKAWRETVYPADSLEGHRYVQELLQVLRSEGFLLAHISSHELHSDRRQTVKINTSQRFDWMGLRRGDLPESILFRAGYDPRVFEQKAVNFKNLTGLFEKILDHSERSGYPFASIRLDSISLSDQMLSAAIRYDPGPLIRFDTLKLTGNTKTKPIFLARSLRVFPGEPFSQRQIDRSIQSLRGIPYLQLGGEPSLSFQNQEATLYLPINDRRINRVDGIIGVLPNEIEGNRLLVTGQFDVALYNVSGRGRNYQINWQRLSQYSQNLRLTATEPLVFGTAIDVNASFFLLKEDTTFLNRDLRIELGYRINPSLYLSFFNRRQAGDLLSTLHLREATQLPSAADFRFANYGMDLEFTSLDDAFFPKRGSRADVEVGIGNKRILQNTGLAPELYHDLLGRSIQYYVEGGYSLYQVWRSSFGTLFRFRGGLMENPNLLLNDLFRIGGLATIRGFNENHFFASRYGYMNIEPRFYFDTSSYFLIFADAAVMENRLNEIQRDLPYSFGGGFSMQTRGGIFQFVYAVGKSASQPLGFNHSRVHFGYTGRF